MEEAVGNVSCGIQEESLGVSLGIINVDGG